MTERYWSEHRERAQYDTREWRVGAHYGVHVYAVNPDSEDEPIASFLGEPEQARRLAEQMVAEHAMLSAPYADDDHRGGHWLDVLPQRPRWAPEPRDARYRAAQRKAKAMAKRVSGGPYQ